MEIEDKDDARNSSGQGIDEIRLVFGRLKREPLSKMERIGRFIGLVAGKIRQRKPRVKRPPEKDVA
jgi:hypothetical protein